MPTNVEEALNDSIWPVLPVEGSSECQNMYWRLMYTLQTQHCMTSRIIHELKYTTCCDHDVDLTHLRRSLGQDMSKSALNNILNHEETTKDKTEAELAIYHNYLMIKKTIYNCFNQENKFRYMVHFKADEILWSGAVLAAGISLLPKLLRKLR